MGTQKTAGILLIVGSILCLIAAFLPISIQVFSQSDAAKQVEIIKSQKTAWTIDVLIFALGAIGTAAGIALTYHHFRKLPRVRWALIGVAAYLLGTLVWCWICYNRVVDPSNISGVFQKQNFLVYSILNHKSGCLLLEFFCCERTCVNGLGGLLPVWLSYISLVLF